MAQTIKLKRSATTGKVPSTSNLALGELAVNTYDGRIFFKKNDGSDSIEHIVTTNSITTGSVSIVGQLTVDGNISGSSFNGTGIISGSSQIAFDDNVKLNLGNSNDLQIYHDGTDSYVRNYTSPGDLKITAEANAVEINKLSGDDTGNNMARFVVNGAVELYYFGEKKLETTTDGIAITGNISGSSFNGTGLISGSDITLTTAAQPNVTSLGTLTSLTVDDISINGSTISDSGDFTLDVGGDITLDTDGADIILKDGGTAFGRFKRDTSDFVIKSETQDKDILFKGNDGGATVTALTLDMSAAGAASFNSTISATGATLTSLSNQASEATALMIDGSNVVGTRELGSNAFNSTAFTTNTGTVTNVTVGTGLDVADGTTTPDITLDLSEFSETTTLNSNSAGDEFIVLDGNAERKIKPININLSAFNNDSGFISSFDITTQTDPKYLRSNATDTATGALTFTGDSKFTGQTNFQIMGDNNAIFISSSDSYDPAEDTGLLYIGGYQSGNTSTAGIIIDYVDTKLNVKGLEIVTSDTIDMNGTTQSTSKTTGTLQVAGGVGIVKTLNVGEDVVAYASSDERYKDLITPIENPNEKIKLLSGNTFVWNDKHEVFKGKKDIGVIAQEVEKVLPEIVETRDNGYKAVKYEKIVALLIESNKELLKRVEELESKIK